MAKPYERRGEAAILLGGIVLFLVLLLGFPFLANIVYSLSRVQFRALWSPQWTALDNYVAVLTDRAFWDAMGFSLRFALICTAAELLLGFLLVIVIEPLITRRSWLMAFLLLPMMISPALLGVMYRLMLNDFIGVVPQYLQMVGFTGNLLGPDWVFTTVMVIEILQWTPFAFLALLTAYQAIPRDLTEAARIDGARTFGLLRHIELPLMLPALAITGFIRFIDSFRVFDHIYVLTAGGPGTLTTSVSIYIYKTFFQQEQIGPAVAASMILLIISLVVLRVTMRLMVRGARA